MYANIQCCERHGEQQSDRFQLEFPMTASYSHFCDRATSDQLEECIKMFFLKDFADELAEYSMHIQDIFEYVIMSGHCYTCQFTC